MRVIFILALLLSAIPPTASDRPCQVTPASWDYAYYAVRVSHEELEQNRTLTYTATPPVTLYAQHYITDTYVITMPNSTPPITRTIWTFEFSETTSLLGYDPYTPRPHDYAYMFRSFAPFHTWACTAGAQAHTFLPIVNR